MKKSSGLLYAADTRVEECSWHSRWDTIIIIIIIIIIIKIKNKKNNNNEYVLYRAIPRKNELNAFNYKCTTDE